MDFHLTVHRAVYQRQASLMTIFANLFGITACVLLLIWLLHYRGGIHYDSNFPELVFNCHPFFMFIGFVFLSGQAMMAYKTGTANKKVQKFIHMLLNLTAFCMGIVGICAVFKFHDMGNLKDMYSFHSWIGLSTFILFGLQWVFGLCTFLFPGAPVEMRARMKPWHIAGGRALLFMSICTALTGLMEKATFLTLRDQPEGRLVSFTGLAILLFGIFVDLSIFLGRYA